VLALELAYRLLGVPFAPWYHVATVALLTALAAAGAWWVAHLVARRIPGAERGGGVLEAALAVALLLPVVAPSLLYLARQGTAPPDPRQPLYQAVGTWLAHHSAPGDAVAAVEIGALGYASRRPVLDLMGLVSPRALAARAAGSLGDLVAAEKPRFLVDVPRLRPLGLGEVLAHPGVRGAYRLRATFRHPPFGGPPVRLLERAPAPSNAPFHGVQRRVPPAVPKTAGPG
jgi:hypothetical protein